MRMRRENLNKTQIRFKDVSYSRDERALGMISNFKLTLPEMDPSDLVFD